MAEPKTLILKMEYKTLKSSMEDLEEIVELNRTIFEGMYESEPYSLSKYKSRLQAKNPEIFITKDDGKIIANSISFQEANSLYLWILGVSPNHRNKKIASKLLDHLEQSARSQGLTSVTTKVYPVSKKMQQLLKQRNYVITKTDEAIHFELKL